MPRLLLIWKPTSAQTVRCRLSSAAAVWISASQAYKTFQSCPCNASLQLARLAPGSGITAWFRSGTSGHFSTRSRSLTHPCHVFCFACRRVRGSDERRAGATADEVVAAAGSSWSAERVQIKCKLLLACSALLCFTKACCQYTQHCFQI